ncbi:MAG: hypothetical protein N2491_05070 [Negativicutes bacterium]|nr:hypothetical protein [Negativicutes bacterium]
MTQERDKQAPQSQINRNETNLSSQLAGRQQPANVVIPGNQAPATTNMTGASAGVGQSRLRGQAAAQKMAKETGLEYTSDVLRQEKLKPKNQQAANSLVDRMLWQREESISKAVSVGDDGSLEDYDDTPGLGNDKAGV